MKSTAESVPSADRPSRAAMLVIFLTVFIDLIGFGIVLPLLPLYADRFSADTHGWQIGGLMASYSLMQFLFAPIWGRVSDQVGRRPILLLGLLGSVVFYTLFGVAAWAESFWGLLICRLGAGIAGATIPTAQAYIADTTTNENRTRGMALIGMAFGLGFTFGPVFALAAISTEGGELGAGPGFLAASFSCLALILAWFKLPEPARKVGLERGAWYQWRVWQEALESQAVVWLVVGFFHCIMAFALYETSLSMLLKGSEDFPDPPFTFTTTQVALTFFAIGLLAALYQGVVIRPLTKFISTQTLAITGTVLELIGFLLAAEAARQASVMGLFISIAVIGGGYGCLQPSLFSLLSRWSDPRRQGTTLGVGQSVSAMARILGALVAIPLIKYQVSLPYLAAAGLMGLGGLAIAIACRWGRDYGPKASTPAEHPAGH